MASPALVSAENRSSSWHQSMFSRQDLAAALGCAIKEDKIVKAQLAFTLCQALL